ncbi:MAG: GIDE domain-containing protein [Candidatus Micrarchaeota archaeon]
MDWNLIAKEFGFPVSLCLAGLAIMAYHLPKVLLIQKIRNTPSSKIRSAAVGLVELSGTPERPGNLRSPLSGEECLYWRIVAQYQPFGTRGAMLDICDTESSDPFILRDDSGEIRVDARSAYIDGQKSKDYSFCLNDSPKGWQGGKESYDNMQKFIDGLDPELKKEFLSHKKYQIEIMESWLPPSNKLYVIGIAEPSEKISSKAHENLVVRGKTKMFISPSSENKVLGNLGRKAGLYVLLGLFIFAVSIILMAGKSYLLG